jgi:hypothetical protein
VTLSAGDVAAINAAAIDLALNRPSPSKVDDLLALLISFGVAVSREGVMGVLQDLHEKERIYLMGEEEYYLTT